MKTVMRYDHGRENMEQNAVNFLGEEDELRGAIDGRGRKAVRPGPTADIVQKQDQRTGRLTRGVVKAVPTKSSFHQHGIKVRQESGEVGRVTEVVSEG